jgi:hypothetical protein
MGELHEILERDGKQIALRNGENRPLIEAAATYMADENPGIGFLFSGWCQAALPHRKLPDDQSWTIESERVTLLVQPGQRPSPGGVVNLGVPYGSRARLIMLYLQSEALRTRSRDIELGRNMADWLGRMGIPTGGKSRAGVREQAARISACRFTFHIVSPGARGLVNQNIVDTAMFFRDHPGEQGSLFLESARLSEGFFEQLQRHPVPLEEAAIRAINNNSMALDVYAWLAYRLHALKAPTPVSWAALKAQFGVAFDRLKDFRDAFKPNLALALAVYPRAKVSEDGRGLLLYPSPPPVAPKLIAVKTI